MSLASAQPVFVYCMLYAALARGNHINIKCLLSTCVESRGVAESADTAGRGSAVAPAITHHYSC